MVKVTNSISKFYIYHVNGFSDPSSLAFQQLFPIQKYKSSYHFRYLNCCQSLYSYATDLKLGSSTFFFLFFSNLFPYKSSYHFRYLNCHQILYSNATDLKLGSSTFFFFVLQQLFPIQIFLPFPIFKLLSNLIFESLQSSNLAVLLSLFFSFHFQYSQSARF